jgi:Rod binding domain-containing protein
MNDSVSVSLASVASAAGRAYDLSAPVPTLGRGKNAAREFEGQLIGSLLESLEKTFSSVPGGQSSPGADDYNHIATQALAGALADKGGFGIAAMISKYLAAHESTVDSQVTDGRQTAKASPTPADRTR